MSYIYIFTKVQATMHIHSIYTWDETKEIHSICCIWGTRVQSWNETCDMSWPQKTENMNRGAYVGVVCINKKYICRRTCRMEKVNDWGRNFQGITFEEEGMGEASQPLKLQTEEGL